MESIWSGSEVDATLAGGSTRSAVVDEDPNSGWRGREAGSLVSQAFGINKVSNINQEYIVFFISKIF
jgi:hypothetical protein